MQAAIDEMLLRRTSIFTGSIFEPRDKREEVARL